MTRPSLRPVRSRWTGIALLTLVATGLVGCGDDGPDVGTASTPGATTSATPTQTPTVEPTPEVQWPNGQVVDIGVASVRVPRAWTVDPMPLKYAFQVRVPSRGTVMVAAFPNFGDLTAEDEVQISLEEIEQQFRDSSGDKENFEVLERREVNGVLMAQVVHGREGWSPTRAFMVEHADDRVNFTFMMRAEFPPQDPVIDQILSTVEWHEERD